MPERVASGRYLSKEPWGFAELVPSLTALQLWACRAHLEGGGSPFPRYVQRVQHPSRIVLMLSSAAADGVCPKQARSGPLCQRRNTEWELRTNWLKEFWPGVGQVLNESCLLLQGSWIWSIFTMSVQFRPSPSPTVSQGPDLAVTLARRSSLAWQYHSSWIKVSREVLAPVILETWPRGVEMDRKSPFPSKLLIQNGPVGSKQGQGRIMAC